jgi:ribonuclease P protein component
MAMSVDSGTGGLVGDSGRIVHKADFERLLGSRPRARSAHFVLHHVPAAPFQSRAGSTVAGRDNLSTGSERVSTEVVDKSVAGCWFGCVIPKRHARRAVTRSLLKRQARTAFLRHLSVLGPGMWLARLRVGYPVATFVSARSQALSQVVRCELDQLFSHATA